MVVERARERPAASKSSIIAREQRETRSHRAISSCTRPLILSFTFSRLHHRGSKALAHVGAQVRALVFLFIRPFVGRSVGRSVVRTFFYAALLRTRLTSRARGPVITPRSRYTYLPPSRPRLRKTSPPSYARDYTGNLLR